MPFDINEFFNINVDKAKKKMSDTMNDTKEKVSNVKEKTKSSVKKIKEKTGHTVKSFHKSSHPEGDSVHKKKHQEDNTDNGDGSFSLGQLEKVEDIRENIHDLSTRSVRQIDKAWQFMTDQNDGDNELTKMAKRPILIGLWTLLIFFGFLGGWATIPKIDSAAIARGSVVLDANRKTIQHLEGGIISEILVRDGDVVEKGDPLVRLSETSASARQELLLGQLRVAKATEKRLIAERDNLDTLVFDDPIFEDRDNPNIKETLDNQSRLFETRVKAVNGQINILKQRIEQLNDEIEGLTAQETSIDDQYALISQEVESISKLYEKKLVDHSRLLALQRKQAALKGSKGEYAALIAKAKQSITETELEMANIRNTFLNEVVAELKETQVAISDLLERKRASSDILERIVIHAPYSGVITGLNYHTVGGVIAPGAAIMDIIPQDDKLIIEAQVQPQDIEVVHVGLTAKVMLSAYSARTTPRIDGEVIHVSADRFIDENTGLAYYIARVQIDEEMIAKLSDADVKLYPGMPADVFIVTGTRSFLDYLTSPITASFRKAFLEQ